MRFFLSILAVLLFAVSAFPQAQSYPPTLVGGTVNPSSLDNTLWLDAGASGDFGTKFNSAYASCLPGTCSIKIWSSTGNRTNFTVPMTVTTIDKNLNLECVSPSNSNGTGGLVLNYTPTTATAMLTIDTAKTSGVAWIPQEIRGCTFVNNQNFVQGGNGSSATGIASGMTNGGIGWLKLVNSAVLGFGTGILLQNSTGGWGVDCDNSTIGDNTTGVSITAAQEVFHMSRCRVMSNGTGLKSTASGDIVVVQDQFDSNTVAAFDFSGATGGMFSSVAAHYENFNTSNCLFGTSVLNNYISGGTILNDNTTGNCTAEFTFSGATSSVIDGVALSSAGQTATNVFQMGDPACAHFVIQNNTPSVFTTKASVIGGSTTCAPVGTIINKGAASQKNPYYFSDGAQGAPGIAFFSDALTGFARVGAGTTQYVSAGSDGALQTNVEIRNGNLGRFGWSSAADALSAASDTGLSRDAAGVVDVGTGAQGSTAGTLKVASIQALTGAVTPNAAAGTDIGSTLLPFANLWLGTAATNNFKFQPAATSAARVISILDPGAATTLDLTSNTSTTTTQVLHASATAGVGTYSAIATGDLPTAIPIGNVGSAGLSGTAPATISAAGAIGCATCVTSSASITSNVLPKGSGGAQGVANSLLTDSGIVLTYTGTGGAKAAEFIANTGTACTNGELALSANWGASATATLVAGTGQTCQWTITANGTTGANPTVTDTLTNALPAATTVCDMRMVGGTGTATLINQTSLSATAPIFTFGGTPVSLSTYIVVRRCGP